MLLLEALVVGDVVFLHPEEGVVLAVHHLVDVVGYQAELVAGDVALVLVLGSVEAIFGAESEVLREVGVDIEVTHDALAQQTVVFLQGQGHGVPGRGTVDGGGTCPVAVEVTHGDVGLHGHGLHDHTVRTVVEGDFLIGAGVGQRAAELEPLGELRVEVEAGVEAVEVRADDDTVLLHPAARHGVGQLLVTARHAHLVGGHERGAENLILPVCSGAQERGVEESLVELLLGDDALVVELVLVHGILREVHHIDFLGDCLPGHIAVVGHVGVAGLAAAGGHDDHTVGARRTVDGAGRGILEHVDRDDVGGGDGGQGVDLGLAVGAAGPVETADVAAGG